MAAKPTDGGCYIDSASNSENLAIQAERLFDAVSEVKAAKAAELAEEVESWSDDDGFYMDHEEEVRLGIAPLEEELEEEY